MDTEFKSDCGRVREAQCVDLTRMLSVTVGILGTTILVHGAVICESSGFFKNAMKPEWVSARADPRVVDLSDERLDTFMIYIHWLYFKTLPTLTTENPTNAGNPEYEKLAYCYVLGEKLLDVKFKNATIAALVDAQENQPFYKTSCPGVRAIDIIYMGTMKGSPARKVVVDMWAYRGHEEWTTVLDTYPADFVLELCKALLVL